MRYIRWPINDGNFWTIWIQFIHRWRKEHRTYMNDLNFIYMSISWLDIIHNLFDWYHKSFNVRPPPIVELLSSVHTQQSSQNFNPRHSVLIFTPLSRNLTVLIYNFHDPWMAAQPFIHCPKQILVSTWQGLDSTSHVWEVPY